MKVVERIIRGLFLFLFGLTIGGISMWITTMSVLKRDRFDGRTGQKISYRDYYFDRKISG